MATLKTNIATAQDSSSPKQRPNGFLINGGLSRVTATYTTTGSEAAGDVIDIADIPTGSQLIPSLCRVSTNGTGGTGAAISKLGDAGSDNRYSATSVAVDSAASTAVTPANAVAIAPYAIVAGNERIKATLALTSGSITAGKIITFLLVYAQVGD